MSKYEAAIAKAFKDDMSRAMARERIAAWENVPGAEKFILDSIHLFGQANDMVAAGQKTPQQADEFIFSTMTDGWGMPAHLLQPVRSWYDAAAAEASAEQPPETAPEQPAAPAPAQPAPAAAAPAAAGPTRDQLRQEITRWESAMRSPEGSEPWREYWRGGGSQAYASALRAMDAADAAPAPDDSVVAPAPAQAQPAASAEPAAPGA